MIPRAGLVAIAAIAALARSHAEAQTSRSVVPAPRTLTAGVSIHESLAGGQQALFTFDVPAGAAAHVTVTQEGIDVKAILRHRGAPAPSYSLDFVAGPQGVEHLYPGIADADAAWEIVLGTALPRAERGDFTIALETSPADDHARAVAAARDRHYVALDPTPVVDNASTSNAQAGYVAAAAMALDAGDIEQAAESTFQAARTYDVLGDQPTAIEWQRRALKLFHDLGRRDREARVLNRLGDLSRKVGAMSDAERYFAEALPLSKASQDAVNVADILNNSGLLMFAMGRFEEALDALQPAIPLAQDTSADTVEAALTHNIGEAYYALGELDKSIDFYQRSIEVKKRMRLPRRVARSQQSLALAYFSQGDRPRAESMAKSAIDLYEQSGDRVGLAEALGTFGLIEHAAGDTDHALELFARAQPLLHETQNRYGEGDVLTAWAEVQADRGANDDALRKATEALSLGRQIASPHHTQKALYVRARALMQMERLDEATAAIVEAIDSVEAMRGALRRVELRNSYLANVRRYYDFYIDLLNRRGRAAEAFEVSERARARTLLEGLAASASQISKGVDRTLLARRQAIQADLNGKEAYRAQLAVAGANQAKMAAVTRDIDRLLDEWRAVRAEIHTRSPSYPALDMPEPIDVERVQQRLLDAGSAIVEYHLGASRGYVWVVDKQSVTVHSLPAAAQIDDAARRYHELLSRDVDALPAAERDAVDGQIRALGARVAAMAWKPIEARVRGKRLLIVADGVLQYVPFAALPDSAGKPLLAAHEITYLPSASVVDTIRQRSRPLAFAGAKAAVFADPVFSRSDARFAAARDAAAPRQSRANDGGLYGRLRFSRAEADAIRAVAPGAFEALDFAAAKQTVVSRDLRQYRILHFATHGSLNTERPELSGLVFSLVDRSGKPVDGFLRLHEIYNLDLDADLVVLSACRTALGKEVHGEGLIGLTRGFIYAGASRVVSSVWNVDDRASARLMTRFYEAMVTRKLAPAAALREAQLSLLGEPRWADPHYWAAFGLQGEWR